jgi:hypothetical protein
MDVSETDIAAIKSVTDGLASTRELLKNILNKYVNNFPEA